MILTGKAKEDFLNYCYNNKEKLFNRLIPCFQDVLDELEYLSTPLKNTLIIEFFDNMEHKGIRMYSDFFSFYWKHKIGSQSFNDVCIQTIEMCNKFYNELELHQLPNYEKQT